jgi:hypothetical protein
VAARLAAEVLLVCLAGPLLGATAGQKQDAKPAEPHGSDALKNLPVGPFHLDVGGSVRFRFEYQDDFNQQRYADNRPGFHRDDFLLQRTRLDLNLRLREGARFYVELQDARVYGTGVDYHLFRLDQRKDAWYWSSGRSARQDATGKAGPNLGQEIDAILNYKYSRHWEFMAGYSHFFPGAFMERTGASPDADWFFVQMQYSF